MHLTAPTLFLAHLLSTSLLLILPTSALNEPCAPNAAVDTCLPLGSACGEDRTCGGAGAECTASNGTPFGLTEMCRSGKCKNGECIRPVPLPIAFDCAWDYDCDGFETTCRNTCYPAGMRICTAVGGGGTGSTAPGVCDSGMCSNYLCTNYPPESTLGSTCSSDAGCIGAGPLGANLGCGDVPPGGYYGQCGGVGASCTPDAETVDEAKLTCVTGRCVNNKCADETPFPLGTRCSEHSQCSPGVQCASDQFATRTCGGRSAWCTVPAGTVGGPSNQCAGKQLGQTGYCMDGGSNGYCTDSTNTVGSYCEGDWWDEFDLDCIGTNAAGNSLVYCATSNSRCGGPGARCKADDGSDNGATSVCQTGQCVNGKCGNLNHAVGSDCFYNTDCEAGVSCGSGKCGGKRASCPVVQTQLGHFTDVCWGGAVGTPGFCRWFQCTIPPTQLGPGPSCNENLDCPGTNPSGMGLIECANGICGGPGAACTADNGGAEGSSSLCASGQCKASKCAAAQVSPLPRKRGDQQAVVINKENAPIWHACPPGRTACPAAGRDEGYECLDTTRDLESCGGCVGPLFPGQDCTAMYMVTAVDCVNGECVVGGCEDGFGVSPINGTCVAE